MKLEAGKIYVIDFFASWCESCKKEMPLLIKASKEMDREKFELIGVDVDEDIKKGKEFQREQSISFRVVDDPKGEIIKAFDLLECQVSILSRWEGFKTSFLFWGGLGLDWKESGLGRLIILGIGSVKKGRQGRQDLEGRLGINF